MSSSIQAEHRSLKAVALEFQRSEAGTAWAQLLTTVLPLVALLAALHTGLAFGFWPALVLVIPAAAFIVRLFTLQHDCGHGSLFRSRRLNDAVGRFCSLFTLTPYDHWRRQHAAHHGAWNDLDRRDRGTDIYSTCATLDEYRAMGRWKRVGYRALRHPMIALVLLPPIVFIALYRVPFDAPKGWEREKRGVYLTNVALLLVYGGLGLAVGFGQLALVLGLTILFASMAGVWLFSVQHRFEGVQWSRHEDWNPVTASLEGTSFLRLPRLLRWLTGAIGFHHVHHLAPRVPNYRLAECHAAHPGFSTAREISFRQAFAAPSHVLWDEAAGRMLTFAEARSLV